LRDHPAPRFSFLEVFLQMHSCVEFPSILA
jgi:hypothetical protein